MITVLTPTYNRAHTLSDLYSSLVQQTKYDFEWLVIDDGSSDDTELLVSQYAQEAPFSIRYIRKNNGGKHSALNIGFTEALYEWIFIVDSDDSLKYDAIEVILKETSKLSNDFNSLCILRTYKDGSVIGDKFPSELENYFDRNYQRIRGDKAHIIRKSAVEKFQFPEFYNENFMAEAPLCIWLGNTGKTRFLNFKGYICEYLDNGLTANSIKNRYRCVNSSLYVYKTLYENYNKPLFKIKAATNWWRFRLFQDIQDKDYKMPLRYMPLGLGLYTLDKLRKK